MVNFSQVILLEFINYKIILKSREIPIRHRRQMFWDLRFANADFRLKIGGREKWTEGGRQRAEGGRIGDGRREKFLFIKLNI